MMRRLLTVSEARTANAVCLTSTKLLQEAAAACKADRRYTNDSATFSGRTSTSLYPTHSPLGPLQRGAVALASAFGAALNPGRADLVAALGETTGIQLLGPAPSSVKHGVTAFQKMHARMQANNLGRKILEEKPRITNQVLESVAEMPAGTFGRAYADFMGKRHFEADDRPPVRFIDDVELAYVAQRARETHDLWHVMFSCPTTVAGELALKALEFVQTGLPMAALSVVGAQWRLKSADRTWLLTEAIPWALQAGSRCPDLMCIPYEAHFQDNMEDLRRRWRIIPAPPRRRPLQV